MKIFNALVFFVICSVSFCSAQSAQNIDRDSANIELERQIISSQQIQLRDSINQSLALINTKINKTPSSKRKKLEQARKDLLLNKEIIQRDINEVGLTARNSWTDENLKRYKINVDQVRREHVRLRSTLKN